MSDTSKPSGAPASVQVLQLLFGLFIPKALAAAAELNIADYLVKEPLRADQLATKIDVHAPSLYRLLRALASVGVFREDEQRRFSNTELSNVLRADEPDSMRSMALFLCGGPHWAAWGEFLYSVRTGQSAFERVHGGRPFDYMERDRSFAANFDDAMTRLTAKELASIHRHLDVSAIKTLVDVGGGHGALLLSCLQRNVSQRGILFDAPAVLAKAQPQLEASGVADRCELVSGDFFGSIPRGDGYIMKYILHDWSDEEALRILRSIHRAAAPGTPLFVLETVIKPGNEADFAKLLDVQVLAFYGTGRERTLPELTALFTAAGFQLVRTKSTETTVTILEAQRV
ncbi:MAG TPA: methyltransferase [Polyangiaceae bacterium]|nr:methyltransferase [Polyangiaceae bacterium]